MTKSASTYLLCLLLAGSCRQSAFLPASPNIVLILADDQGWTGTSVQSDRTRPDSKSDYYETSNFEHLARQGMRFSNAYAPSPMCSPTRASLQTGKSPAQLHMTDIIEGGDPEHDRYKRNYLGKKLVPPLPRTGLADDEITIAELIHANRAEYVTAHFGKWHLGGGGPGAHGYDVHDGDTGNYDGLSDDPDPKETFSVSARAVDFMKERNSAGEPFFVQVSYYAVHLPLRTLSSTAAKYASKPVGTRHAHSLHAAMTEDLDTGVGMILDEIERLGIEDRTYVIYTSDNGAYIDPYARMTNNLPLAKGKGHTWEGGIRVPLIIRGPNIPPNSQSDAPVIGWDFLPTILGWLRIDASLPAGVEGGDLSPLLAAGGRGIVRRPRDELVWHYPHYIGSRRVKPQTALRLGNYKLIYEYENGRSYLFDLSEDLEERVDLSEREVMTAAALREQLRDYLHQIDAPLPE